MNHTDFERSVIEILRGSPNGLTAIEIAQRLGTTAGNINSRLSKLAAYGIIGRVRGTLVHHASRGNVYLAPVTTDVKEPRRVANNGLALVSPDYE